MHEMCILGSYTPSRTKYSRNGVYERVLLDMYETRKAQHLHSVGTNEDNEKQNKPRLNF